MFHVVCPVPTPHLVYLTSFTIVFSQDNIVSSLGTTVKGDFTEGVILGEMTNQLLQLQRDVSELLPEEKIDELSKDADAWAATQRQRLLERRKVTRQRLEAARQTGDVDPDKVIKKPGAEAERFD